jgi:hypothetical protein
MVKALKCKDINSEKQFIFNNGNLFHFMVIVTAEGNDYPIHPFF